MKEAEAQRITDEYQSRMRQNEIALEEVERKERRLKKQEEEMIAFKEKIFFFLNDEAEYQEKGDDLWELDNLQEAISEDFRQIEEKYEEEYDRIQAEKKRLYESEDEYTGKYYEMMRRLEDEQ